LHPKEPGHKRGRGRPAVNEKEEALAGEV